MSHIVEIEEFVLKSKRFKILWLSYGNVVVDNDIWMTSWEVFSQMQIQIQLLDEGKHNINGLMQNCGISSSNALEIPQSCMKPSWYCTCTSWYCWCNKSAENPGPLSRSWHHFHSSWPTANTITRYCWLPSCHFIDQHEITHSIYSIYAEIILIHLSTSRHIFKQNTNRRW